MSLFNADDIDRAEALISKQAERLISEEIPRQLVSEWAEKNRILTEGPMQGPFSFDQTPYLKEIADALSPSCEDVREVAFMKPSRIGATVAVLENWIGATIDAFPCEMGYITSQSDMAEAQMSLRVDGLLNSSGIGHKIGNVQKRKGQNKTGDKTVQKTFPGGYLVAGGPRSSFFKRALGFKFLAVDEPDSFPDNIDKEGDPIGLFRRRVSSYQYDSKILWISSPGFTHNSKINRLFLEGDQRRFFVPCRHCGHYQYLKWGKKDEKGGLKFSYNEEHRLDCKIDKSGKIIESSVHYECEECGGLWDNADKDYFLPLGEWRPTATPRRAGMRSYHLNALNAPVWSVSWEVGVMEYLELKHNGFPPLEFQVWINTFLGEPFEDRGQRPKIESLLARKDGYSIGTLPENSNVLFLTAWADVQAGANSRIELEVVGWAKDSVSYSIDYIVIPGDTSNENNEVYQKLDDILCSEHAGRVITLAGVDCGDQTAVVSRFCDNAKSNVYPTMGMENIKRAMFKEVSFGYNKPRYEINTNMFKQEIYSNLSKGRRVDGSIPGGFCFFPNEYGRKYFNMLTAEDRIVVKEGGRTKSKWDAKKRRNEAFDCRVGNSCLRNVIKELYQVHARKKNIIPVDYEMKWGDFWSYVEQLNNNLDKD